VGTLYILRHSLALQNLSFALVTDATAGNGEPAAAGGALSLVPGRS